HSHIGSCTKAMTATLIAMLVEEHKLRWEMTIAEGLPKLAASIDRSYRDVTLAQLLSHWGGIPANGNQDQPAGPVTEQRLSYIRQVLSQPSPVGPCKQWVYSNAGYVIAAAIAEQAARSSWEDLMQRRIFRPLRMTTAGFGPPGIPDRLDHPWAHQL